MINPIHAVTGFFLHNDFILNEYRIPRTLLGLLIGSSLAISGSVIQGVIRNPLASPDVIGITKGASLAAVMIIMIFPSAPLFVLPLGSFIGALTISIILSVLISKFDVKGSKLALIGLAIGAICTAIVQFLLIRNPLDANNALLWLTGSLYGHNIVNFYSYPSLLEIAPEPFEEVAFEHYLECLTMKKYKNKPIKQTILDHRVIAGAGNIYACEALFRAGITPDKITNSLTKQERKSLFYYVREVLEEGIKYGGTSISDYRHADGKTGQMQLHLNVYKQKKCKVCGHSIETKVIAGRNSHFCPNCQR